MLSDSKKIASPDEIRKNSVVEVTKYDTYEN